MLYSALFDAIADQASIELLQPSPSRTARLTPCTGDLVSRAIGNFSEVGRKFNKYWDVMWMDRPLKPPETP